MKHWIYKRGDS